MVPDQRELHPDVVRFVEERIESVPHLEALLLLCESAAASWTVDQVAARLYVSVDRAQAILDDLRKQDLARSERIDATLRYRYDTAWDPGGEQMKRIGEAYRRQLARVATLIHARASTAVRDFARAFVIKKE